MAAQTYVWDHQTFKGEGDGDIDGGGFANADIGGTLPKKDQQSGTLYLHCPTVEVQ